MQDDEPGTLHVPQMSQSVETVDEDAPVKTVATPTVREALSADITAAWGTLDRNARLLVSGSAAAITLVIIGLPLSVWDSANFALLILTASIFAIVTAWFGTSQTARSMPIRISTIELLATGVAASLGVMKAVEVLFDLDRDGVVGLALAIALAIATVMMVSAAMRRGADPLGAVATGDQGVKVAAAGLAIVLVGWAINLSLGFWTMQQAALPLAVLVIAALTVVEAPRISSPIPVAWVGAAIAVFAAILAIGHWGDLTRLGRTEVSLDVVDYLGFLGYALGAVLVIVGGALSGRIAWSSRQPALVAAAATPSAPSAPWVPASPADVVPDDDRSEPAG